MKITDANGVTGILLNPYHQDGKWVFRVHSKDGAFTDYDLCHSDLCVTINDNDAFFYAGGNGSRLDHSPETILGTGSINMTLFAQIKSDQLSARKAKETLKATLLTTLIGELTAVGKNDGNREVTDADVVKLVKKFLDGVNESIKFMEAAGNETALTMLRGEAAILAPYLPQQMSEAELTVVVKQLVDELGAGANMGQVMAALKTRHAGTYDGSMASRVVKACI